MLSKYEIKKLICKRQVKLFSLSPIFKFRTVRKVQYGEVIKCNIWTLNLKTHFVRHQTSTNIWAPYIYNDVVSDSTCKWRDWGRPCQSGERRWPVCWEPQEELSTLSPSALTTPSASVPLLLVFWAFQEQTGVSLNVMSHYILSPSVRVKFQC